MNKKIIYFIIILAIIIISFVIIKNYFNKKTNVNDTTTTTLVGGDKDSHGCLIGAGYQWCPSKQECQRLWEGKCDPDLNKIVTFVETKDGWVIYYEEPGKPAITKAYILDGKCMAGTVACKNLTLQTGDKANIKGITLDNEILITSITF